jgi:NAD(P)-dependent dehydrogenase (short-subunit alcohol dehydrogenase family)
MNESTQDDQGSNHAQPDEPRQAVAVFVKCESFKSSLEQRFREWGWDTVPVDTAWNWDGSAPIDCAVVDFGFNCFDAVHDEHVIELGVELTLLELTQSILGEGEGSLNSSFVMLSSRDWLGSPDNPAKSGAAASVVATSRSLALLYAHRGVAVNTICALATTKNGAWERPRSLLPGGVSLDGILDAVLFFADPRNRYVTGQTLNVCGGASLLSSLSV